MIKYSLIITILLLLFPYSFLFSQTLNRSQTISAYIYNFTKHVQWKNEASITEFQIFLLSDDKELETELVTISKTAKVKGKPIKITQSSFPDKSYLNAQVIFISESKSGYFLNLFDMVEGKPILLISENYQDKKLAMINLYDTPEHKLLFEINKSNIINQNLTIDDEILLLGGSVIDVAQLYKTSQQSLRQMEKKMAENEEKLDSLNKLYKKIQTDISLKQKTIDNQTGLLVSQKNEIELQEKKAVEQGKLIDDQKKTLRAQQDSLKKQINKFKETEQLLNNQSRELDAGMIALKTNKLENQQLDSILKEKNILVGEQNITITRQKQLLWSFVAIIFLILVLAFVIYKSYRMIRIRNKDLQRHKIKIEEINSELQSLVEELKTINNELYNKNDELSVTLNKLKETQEQLIQSEKMASLGVLTAGIAHEMNNPINFVYAGVNSLKKDYSDIVPILEEIKKLNGENSSNTELIEKIKLLKESVDYEEILSAILQTIDDINLGAHRTADIIKGLKNFSRIDKEDWQCINIHENIDDALILLKNKYKQTIDIIKNFCTDLPPIECFPGKLNQVFVNLISNSIDAIEGKGQIEITTKTMDDVVVVSVRDTGKGISDEIKAKIFDPFFTTKVVGKGQGLGLSITYGIIEEHMGKINFTSSPEKGTEFIIQLPITHKKNIKYI